jgi:hypothetical protein
MKKIKLTESELMSLIKKITEEIDELPSKSNDYKQKSRKEVKINYFTDLFFPKIMEISDVHGIDIAEGLLDELKNRLMNYSSEE